MTSQPKDHPCSTPAKTKNSSAQSMKSKKSNESLKDRLFRSLKGLKKSSEMRNAPTGSLQSPNGSNVQKKPTKALTVKAGDSSSSASSSALNSPAISTKSNLSDIAGLKELVPEKDVCKKAIPSSFDSDTDEEPAIYDDNSSEGEEVYEKILPLGSSPVTTRKMIEPMFVVRPAPLPGDVSESEEDDEPEREDNESSEDESERRTQMNRMLKKFRKKRKDNLALERDVILPLLPFLQRADVMRCMSVCRLWNSWCMDPCLWNTIDLNGTRLNSTILTGLVVRQPKYLNLSWTNINKQQISWLISRLPRLQALSLSGCSLETISAICVCNCPLLKKLDLSWINGLDDDKVKELTSTPIDSRPGLNETKTRLRFLAEINLSGTDITDASVRLLAHHLTQLTNIDLSNCHKVTDMGIAILGAAKSSKLISLNVSSCSNISDTSLDSLKRCHNLSLLDLRDCNQVSSVACQKFVCLFTKQKLILRPSKLIEAIV